jgi:MFS family permease
LPGAEAFTAGHYTRVRYRETRRACVPRAAVSRRAPSNVRIVQTADLPMRYLPKIEWRIHLKNPMPLSLDSSRGIAAPTATTGWWIVAALFLSGVMVLGGGLYSFILFVPVLTTEFHWSRAATGGLVSAFWLTAPVALFGGVFLKRFGPRKLLVTGVLIEALCIMAFSVASTLPVMYLLRAMMGFGKVLFAVSIPVAIARWFSGRFGLGCAIAWAGWQVGGLILSPLVGWMIAAHGWRAACVALGFIMIAGGVLPLFWVLRRTTPKQSAEPETKVIVSPAGHIAEYRKLFASRPFWLIATAAMFLYFVYAGVLAHQAVLIQESGVSAQWASLALGSTAAFATLGSLAMGWLTDRWRLIWVGTLEHSLLAMGVLALLLFVRQPSPIFLMVHAICFGAGIGGADVFWTTVLKQRVGMGVFDHAYGVWYFFQLSTLLLGPVVSGALYDATGNYILSLAVLLASAIPPGLIAVGLTFRRTRAIAA